MFKKDLVYLLTILEAIEKVNIYTKSFTDSDDFYWENEQMNFNATVNLLIAVGEESKKIDLTLKQLHQEINWRALAGLRDKIAHDYRGIDPLIVWSVVKDELPKLKIAATGMLTELNINQQLLTELIDTQFYQHLSYLLKP